jgi:hypothetical protein
MKKEDFERIIEFQSKISQESTVKYKPDLEIETQVKIEFLTETFGFDTLKSTLDTAGFSFEDLADQEKFNIIYSILEAKS